MTVGILSPRDVADPDRTLQIVDARPRSDFDTGHIPGAIWIGWEDWCDPAPVSRESVLWNRGYWGALRNASHGWYEERLQACGLSGHDPIVVYADGPRSRGREGRIAWMLLYLGAVTVSLLDGGWQAWRDTGGDVEEKRANPPPGHFPVSFQARRRRTVAQLARDRDALSEPLCVDTRSPAEFAGETGAYLPRRGHIPGAALVPFTALFDATGRYVDRKSYAEALPSAVRRTDDIVAYCEVGVRASLFALLHEAYMGRLVSVCDGSLIEWALNTTLPLRTGTIL